MNSLTKNERILITGASGFSARALIQHLRAQGVDDLFLLDRSEDIEAGVVLCDLVNGPQITELLATIRPLKIYHLAGSFTNDYDTDYETNVITTKNILDALVKSGLPARVLLVGSSSEYGVAQQLNNPICEQEDLRPITIYGLTKSFQTMMMNFYVQKYNLDIVMARPFNLYGPGISPRLFAGKVYEQLKKYKEGAVQKITIDDLHARRDYLSVDEAVKKYQLIMDCGKSGDLYNVASGESLSGNEFVRRLAQMEGVELADDAIQETGEKMSVSEFYADIEKLLKLEENS